MRQYTGTGEWIGIGSGYDWSAVRRQAITQSYPDLLSFVLLVPFPKYIAFHLDKYVCENLVKIINS